MAETPIAVRVKRLISKLVKPQTISRLKVYALRRRWMRRLLRLQYFGLNALDREIEKYVSFDKGYFVELGANDGVNQSNTLYFEWFRDWRGLLIEPHPENFRELKRNRSSRNIFRNAACVGPGYSRKLAQLVYSNLMTSTLGVKTDVADPARHAANGLEFWNGKSFIFEAPALTLNQLLAEAQAPTVVDLLSLDVEGAELEILKGVNHSAFRFRFVCVESRNITELKNYLESQNYELVSRLSSHDYLFASVA